MISMFWIGITLLLIKNVLGKNKFVLMCDLKKNIIVLYQFSIWLTDN